MIGSYRAALSLPGARAFSASGFLARLPIAMIGLGIVLMVSTLSGSYARAGVLSAAFQVSAAAGAVYTSRLADRLGQHRLLGPLMTVHALGLVAFVGSVELHAPLAVQVLLAAIAGVAQPAVGSMIRARWVAAAADDPARLRSAFAVESILDELIFTLGPLIAAWLAFSVALPAPILVAAVLSVLGGWALALQRRTQPPVHPVRHDSGSALRVPGLVLVVLAGAGLGGVFGSFEVAVVAFTRDAGAPESSGLVLAVWALGSMVGGLLFGARHYAVSLTTQGIVATALAMLALMPASFISSVGVLAGVTALGGMTIAPCLIVIFSLAQRLVPPSLLTEGLTWVNSGMALGFSAGNLLAGVVIDSYGPTWAFRVSVACALASMLAMIAARARAAERTPRP